MSGIETSGSALATGSIAARFISQNAVDAANDQREQEWKDAYARIGEAPPEKMPEPVHDGRTLFERLKEQEDLKQEEWDNRLKLSNQYRGLDSEELAFLTDKIKEKEDTERRVAEEDAREVQSYREALAKKNADAVAAAEPQLKETAAPKRVPPKPVKKKDIKSLMKGVVVKKKPKVETPTESSAKTAIASVRPPAELEPLIDNKLASSKRPIEDEPLIDKKRKL